MIKYGLISATDAATLEKIINLLMNEFSDNENIKTTEIGIYNGDTSRYVHELIMNDHRKKYVHVHTAIDNEKDKPIQSPFGTCNLIIGNSNEVYNQLEDESQHLIFVDGCHCFAHVISDFFCYAPKIKKGGYFAFHDTGKHIAKFKDFQHGDKENPDAYISVRKALTTIHLLGDNYVAHRSDHFYIDDWELVFDEADSENLAGGICVFKKYLDAR